MARLDRLQVWGSILEAGLIPIFYHPDGEVAFQIVQACWAGGVRAIEFTNRGDRALPIFQALTQRVGREIPEVILGAGTVMDAPTAALYIAGGAHFIVGPILNEEVARLCNRRKVAYIPGCSTLSEISAAEELGAEIVKLFPADCAGGPGFVRAVLGPCPWLRLIPTGGIEPTLESITAWFRAGVAGVGMGSNLIRQEWVKAGDWEAITAQVRQVLEWIRQARPHPIGR